MQRITHPTPKDLGEAAADEAADAIIKAIATNGAARIIVATGASQFEMLANLVTRTDIDWAKVTVFHLDEYIGLSASHPATFRNYLQARLVDKLPTLKAFHPVKGDAADIDAELAQLSKTFLDAPIDLACVGIGENGHLAFNDPPADFETQDVYLRVQLDEACRQQQVNEGWFASLEETPTEAISMSVYHIMQSALLVVSVPDERKASAVRATLDGPITPDVPASILQNHAHCTLHLDQASATKLRT